MVIVCADCGCVVDRGVVNERCDDQHCCCEELPDAIDADDASDPNVAAASIVNQIANRD